MVDPEGRVLAETTGEQGTVLTAVVDLDAVPLARRYGTVGLTRPWSQFGPGDEPLPLPLHQGQIDLGTWTPRTEH